MNNPVDRSPQSGSGLMGDPSGTCLECGKTVYQKSAERIGKLTFCPSCKPEVKKRAENLLDRSQLSFIQRHLNIVLVVAWLLHLIVLLAFSSYIGLIISQVIMIPSVLWYMRQKGYSFWMTVVGLVLLVLIVWLLLPFIRFTLLLLLFVPNVKEDKQVAAIVESFYVSD
jgi:hypothetical protein